MSHSNPRAEAEQRISDACQAGEFRAATTLALQTYGAEIMGFLVARLRDHDLASEAFSQFAQDLWRGIAKFQGRSTLRVWASVLARHAATQAIAGERRRRNQQIPLSDAEDISKVAAAVRTETLRIIRTANSSRLTALRDQLSPDDRTLLILRVNERMEWKDIALVMSDCGVACPKALAREAARLRKRFQLVRDRLRALAIAEGLLDQAD